MSAGPLVVALTRAGAALAERLAPALPDLEILRAGRWAGGCAEPGPDVPAALRAAFVAGRPIVGICATGILVRALAPEIADKRGEPPVVALAEDASAVVPLLGAHRGAVHLAERIGAALGASVIATGASDLRFGVALDDPPRGWRLANPTDHKAFTASLLDGQAVRMVGDAPWLQTSALPFANDAPLTIRVSDARGGGGPRELVYRPARLCVGVGCERDTAAAELIAHVEAVLADQGLAADAVCGVFSVDLKSDEDAMTALATRLGVPARFFTPDRLEAERPRLVHPSEVVFREVGCHGVAEGAALAAAGEQGELITPKRIAGRVTCAIARAPAPIDAMRLGAARGRLAVVGLGPGDPAFTTPETSAALAQASDLVGYSGYLDLVAGKAAPGRRHPYALGEERQRVVAALDLAAAGASVALVCSGDPGIYAMASLVMETLDGARRPGWGRISVDVQPGISALQMAASRAGAPLGHDFCAISLSDLLTPWEVIERRLRAAAEGDFVVALYNPVSRRRTHQLGLALEILGASRPPATPVVVARSLGRDGERVRLTTLGAPDVADVDMVTVVLVGASSTRRVAGRTDLVYTPRGYEVEARARDPGRAT